MKISKARILALILSLFMMIGPLSACSPAEEETSASESATETESNTETDSESASASSSATSQESESNSETESVTESDTESESEVPLIEGEYASTIINANKLMNGVNSYYSDATRSEFVMENQNVTLVYDMKTDGAKQIASISNKQGKTYVENTLDVFIKMKDGSRYYSSTSPSDAVANIYRLGYYYYENRIDNLEFYNEPVIVAQKPINHRVIERYNDTEEVSIIDDTLKIRVTSNEDPWFSFSKVNFAAASYNMLSITIKANSDFSGSVTLYIKAGERAEAESFSNEQSTSFKINPDNEFHTYLVPLDVINGYTGKVTGIRLDPEPFRGALDATLEIKEVKAVNVEYTGAPSSPKICHIFGAYSDKLHHTVQVATAKEVTDVDSIGVVTKIAESTVSKLVVKDATKTHDSIEGVDWATAEYVGFDIKEAGVYGIILPYDGKGGSIEVALEDGFYVITQTKAVKDGTLVPPQPGEKNANDFYMGSRIYTDSKHSFDEFIKNAEEERHPLNERNFSIDVEASTHGEFLGYDSLRGIYTLAIDGAGGFNPHYKLHNNRQYNVTFNVKGEDYADRKIYVMARYDQGGALECAALLNGDSMLIPVPLEVGKNFSDGGGGIYDIDDPLYSETILPIVVEAHQRTKYSIVNMYHKWGAYLLKQISFITYYTPYYHLSTGVHESNCIIPYYFTKSGDSLNLLPDHRPMSAPLWETDPQHTYCGNHYFLQYTDSDGNYSATETTRNTVGSYGPIYADVTMDYITDDGRIKVSYNHMEMPQTDENRAYYEMKYEVLEDISFTDFARDFSFYSATSNDPTGIYTKIGYLDVNNTSCVVNAATGDDSFKLTLGDNCPYFSYFDMDNCTDTRGYSNLSFLIHSYEFTIGGKAADPNFAVISEYGKVSLSLDLESVTLKAGDSFTINAIIMPWGSQELDYSGDAPDKNVRDVRQNSIIDPAKIEAVNNCEAVDTVFLPAVRTTNGKSAEFKLSGGHNNLAVRVYGFEMLTVPKIEELIDGEWVEVKLASIYTPDGMGYGYQYDGYMVYYDGDGTYSYGFVTTMNNGAERTFRVSAEEEFNGWPEIVEDPREKFMFNAAELMTAANKHKGFIGKEIMLEDGKQFIRFSGSNGEAYLALLSENEDPTGDYLVIRYRISANSPNNLYSWNFYTSTSNSTASNSDSYWSDNSIIMNGEWQVLIVDLSAYGNSSFKQVDGTYAVRYLRVDVFNDAVDPKTVCDIEFIALFDSMETALEKVEDTDTVTLSAGRGNNEIIQGSAPVVESDGKMIFDAESIMSAAKTHPQFKPYEMLTENESSFVRFKGANKEAYLALLAANNIVTGNYLVIKYRMPSSNSSKIVSWNFYTSTSNSGASSADSYWANNTVVADGEWQVLIIDLSTFGNDTFKADSNGEYTAKYLRLDVYNGEAAENVVVDIEYVALFTDMEKIFAENADIPAFMLCTNPDTHELITKDSTAMLNLRFNAAQIYAKSSHLSGNKIGSVTLADNQSYVTFTGATTEATTLLFSENKTATGQYFVMKYRISPECENKLGSWNFYTSTVNEGATASDAFYGAGAVFADGEWQVIVVDLASQATASSKTTFNPDANGKYVAKYLRFDIFNGAVADSVGYDISYIGMSDDFETILNYCSEEGKICLVSTKDEYKMISTETGKEITQ